MGKMQKLKMIYGNSVGIYSLKVDNEEIGDNCSFIYTKGTSIYNSDDEVIVDLSKYGYKNGTGIVLEMYNAEKVSGFWVLDNMGKNLNATTNVCCIVTKEGKKVYEDTDATITRADCIVDGKLMSGIRLYNENEDVCNEYGSWAHYDIIFFDRKDALEIVSDERLEDVAVHYNSDENYPVYIGHREGNELIVSTSIMQTYACELLISSAYKVTINGTDINEIDGVEVNLGENTKAFVGTYKDTKMTVLSFEGIAEFNETFADEGNGEARVHMPVNIRSYYKGSNDYKLINGELMYTIDSEGVSINFNEFDVTEMKESEDFEG